MSGVIAEDGEVVTDEMVAKWADALDNDAWPEGWENVAEIVEGRLPKSAPDAVTLSVKIPAAMRRAIEEKARAEGRTTSAYVRGILAESLMASA